MKLVALAAAGFVAASAPASAQYITRPMAPVGLPSAQDAAEIVEAIGLRPIGAPTRNGPFFVQSARDDRGRVLRVTVDARRSQIIAVESGTPRAYGPYAGYAPHHRPAPYPMEDFDIAPPGSIMGSRMTPHGAPPPAMMPSAAQPKPSARSAAVTPKEPPVPRKRPASAPQQTAGSVEPVPVATENTPAPVEKPMSNTSPAAAPEKPATNAMPPVTPLE